MSANLHAYWVYEAKIAFLLAVASSRKGAEDLLNSGIFEVLSMCGFITVQLFAEDTTGMSHQLGEGYELMTFRQWVGNGIDTTATPNLHLYVAASSKDTSEFAQICENWCRPCRSYISRVRV